MIDHLMLQGLKPLSQETGIEDPNKEIEALEYWKRFSSVPPITQMPIQSTNVENNENLDNSISPDELIANKESQEPEPGSYYTDDHLKDNSNNQEVQERKKDGRQLLFEERFPEAIDSDIKYDANNRFDYDASVNAYYERNNIGLRKDKYGTHLLPGYEHLIVNPEDIKESPYAATEKQIMDNIKKHTHELSYSALAGYYYGIDELLDSGISQENINKYFKYDLSKLSKEEQNLRYKKAVVEDILKHAINPEIEKLKDQYLQTIPLGVKPDAPTVEKLKDQIPEETLDYIYDKWWLLEGKDMIDSRYGKTSQQIRDEFLDAKKRPTSEINHLLRVEIPNAVRNKEMPFTFNSSNDLSYQVGPLEIRRFETSRVANDAQNRRYTNLLDRYKQHFNSLDDETKKQTIQEFKELSRQAVPYYYNEFEGTDKLPLNDAQYAQFLAEFYAQADIYGDQQAIQNLTDKYKNIVASNTSWLENKWSAVKQGAVNLAITATGWFVAPIAETIIESSGYSEECGTICC